MDTTSLPNDVRAVFEIPDEMAQELSKQLTISSIRRTMLIELIGKPGKYDELEATIIPVEQKIDGIKTRITNQYVPEEYQNEQYQWLFPGYEIAKNQCWIKMV